MKVPFEFQGQFHEVEAELIKGHLWIHFQGKTWCVEKESTTPRRGKAQGTRSSGNRDLISAPMPGKIIKVMVQSGSLAETGQVLVIMEAMKMEYTLKADRVVQIAEVLVKPGQQVRLGDTLISFKKEESSS
ncbi:MAG: acetyl-CoA carboxylase biotin carboxyl carrier protein subunit [Bdellovibrionaceae bacterium]|nr:acetyl-CoA carboxylase biotin carboxyl carrier protein subunit [Pseudobdellovibrionaceae bacterium]